MKPVHRTGVIVAAGIVIATAVAVMLAVFPREDAAGGPSAPLVAVPPPAGVPAQTPFGPSRADAGPAVAPGRPTEIADLWLACPVLGEGDWHRGLTEECLAALEARFLPMPVSPAILPFSPPLTWNDVFADVGGKIELVEAALADTACDVPDGEIRPDLAVRCAARTMAELQVLRETCAKNLWRFSSTRVPRGGWPRVDRTSYLANITEPMRDLAVARWAEYAPDQQAYVEGKRRAEDRYFRTPWKRAKCAGADGWLDWIGGDGSEDLLGRAARLGDSFALAHHVGSRQHAAKLAERDPPLAHLNLASLELQEVRRQWAEEDSELRRRYIQETLDDHIRLLKLAGVDCGDPCTIESVDAALHSYDALECKDGNCENLAEMLELKSALAGPHEELLLSRPTRSLPHQKRAEAVAMKYVFAVETLARAAGVEVDERLLRQVADPNDPVLLSQGEVEQARTDAAQLVADFQAGLP